MGRTRYLFKKIRDTKGIFHAKTDLLSEKDFMSVYCQDSQRLLL